MSEYDATSRWNCASDLSSHSSGRDSAFRLRIRGGLGCVLCILVMKSKGIARQGHTAIDRRRLYGCESIISTLVNDGLRGGVEGIGAGAPSAFIWASTSEAPLPSGCGGVALPELEELDLSDVHILESLSLSDSSPLLLLNLLRVKEVVKGLRCRLSEDRWLSLGFRRLGFSRCSMKGLSPSEDVLFRTGRSNSEEDAGNEGLSRVVRVVGILQNGGQFHGSR